MKIVIVGAGSPYSPEIFKELSGKSEILPVEEIALVDIDTKRLSIIHSFLERFQSASGIHARHHLTCALGHGAPRRGFRHYPIPRRRKCGAREG